MVDNTACLVIPEGKKLEISMLEHFSGGGATNSAASFVKLGCDATALFKIGSDQAGTFITNDIKTYGITPAAVTSSTEPTGTSFIVMSPSGNHPILVDRGANTTLSENDIPHQTVQSADVIYVTSLSGAAANTFPAIARAARDNNIVLATNPGTSQLSENPIPLRDSLSLVGILILNAYEAKLLMETMKDHFNIQCTKKHPITATSPRLLTEGVLCNEQKCTLYHFFEAMLSHNIRMVVVTNGAEGVYVATASRLLFHPSLKEKITSSVGAGDAFASCFVASIVQGIPVEQAIAYGVINSANVLKHTGAKTGLLTQAELEARYKQLPGNLLQEFKL